MAENPCCCAKSRIFFHSHAGQPRVENAMGIRLALSSAEIRSGHATDARAAADVCLRNSRRFFIAKVLPFSSVALHCAKQSARCFLELPEFDLHHCRIVSVELQATIRFIAVPQSYGLPDSVLIRTFLRRKDLHSHSRQSLRKMEADAHVHSADQKLVRTELRNQRYSVRVTGSWRTAPVVLRKTIRYRRLPRAKIKLLLGFASLLHGCLQLALEVRLGDLPDHGREQRKVPRMAGGRSVAEDIPAMWIDAKRGNPYCTFSQRQKIVAGKRVWFPYLRN